MLPRLATGERIRQRSGVSSGAPSCQNSFAGSEKASPFMLANKYQLWDIMGEVIDAAASRSDLITVHKVTSVPKLRPPMPTLVRSISPFDAKRSMTLLTAERP